MRSTVDGHSCPLESGQTNNNNNSNNNNDHNNSYDNSGNSGSQYALCALGVGLIALGVVMIVWSVVPSEQTFNSSSSTGGGSSIENRRMKASSVAFVLAGSGVAMLLLSLCLGMRNKQRAQLRQQEAQNQREEAAREQEERRSSEEQAQRYAVPTYEEAVGSGRYPVRQSNSRPSTSQLPSYEDLVRVDGMQYENEGSEVTTTTTSLAPPPSTPPPAPAPTSNHRPGKNNRMLLPIKIRRIKSEKLPMKNTGAAQSVSGISIEPLTPPPQYDDKEPPL